MLLTITTEPPIPLVRNEHEGTSLCPKPRRNDDGAKHQADERRHSLERGRRAQLAANNPEDIKLRGPQSRVPPRSPKAKREAH